MRARVGQAELLQRRVNAFQIVERNETEYHILIHRETQHPVPGIARNRGQAAHLVGGQVALLHFHRHNREARLLLLLDVGLKPVFVIRVRPAPVTRAPAGDRRHPAVVLLLGNHQSPRESP